MSTALGSDILWRFLTAFVVVYGGYEGGYAYRIGNSFRYSFGRLIRHWAFVDGVGVCGGGIYTVHSGAVLLYRVGVSGFVSRTDTPRSVWSGEQPFGVTKPLSDYRSVTHI